MTWLEQENWKTLEALVQQEVMGAQEAELQQ